MAGCLNLAEEGNVSPENVRRWTEKLPNVLLSKTARQRFYEYLESRELEEGLTLLKFWEKCNKFLTNYETTKPYGYGQHLRSSNKKKGSLSGTDDWAKALIKDSEEILEFSKEELNFDSELKALDSAVKTGELVKIVTAISDAKIVAVEKLEDEGYHEFCRYLLKKQGLLNNGK